MKLSTRFAKLTCIQSQLIRTLALAVLAGSALTLAAPAASAQQVAFGVQFGQPRYVAPPLAYGYGAYAPRYDGWRDRQAWERQEEWRRHEEWRHREEAFRFHHEQAPFRYDSRSYGYRPY